MHWSQLELCQICTREQRPTFSLKAQFRVFLEGKDLDEGPKHRVLLGSALFSGLLRKQKRLRYKGRAQFPLELELLCCSFGASNTSKMKPRANAPTGNPELQCGEAGCVLRRALETSEHIFLLVPSGVHDPWSNARWASRLHPCVCFLLPEVTHTADRYRDVF